MGRKSRFTVLLLAAALMAQSTMTVNAAEAVFTDIAVEEAFTDQAENTEISTEPETSAEPERPPVQMKTGWVKKPSGRYYWRQENGKILKESGLHKLGGKKYYLNKGGSRASDCWKKVKGKIYYFQKNGVMYQKKGWFVNGKYKYYINSDGSCRIGFYTIKNRLHYFDSKGRILSNKTAIKIDGKYYDIDSKCNVKEVSAAKMECRAETRKFIEKHTSPGMSNSQKFRACFNYLLWYLNFRTKPYSYSEFDRRDWQYEWANEVFTSGLTGDCFGFACCVASCAKELGYDPEVVVTTGDHGFVMIDGAYYDNMGGLFGAYSHTPYSVYCRAKF